MTLPPEEAKQIIESSDSFILVSFEAENNQTSIYGAHRSDQNIYEKHLFLVAQAIYYTMKKTDKGNQEFISDLLDELKYVHENGAFHEEQQ